MSISQPTEDDFNMWMNNSTPEIINPDFIEKQSTTYPNELKSTIPYIINHQLSTYKYFSSLIPPNAKRIGSPTLPNDILTQLLTWGELNGAFIHPFIAFGSIDIHNKKDITTTTNWSVYALERIPPNEIILKIPSNICIQPLLPSPSLSTSNHISTTTTTTATPTNTQTNIINNYPQDKEILFFQLLTECMKLIPPVLIHMFIALRLLFEYNRIEQSYYKPLLQSQPLEYPYLDFLNPSTLFLNPNRSTYMLQQHVTVIQQSFETFINSIMTTKYKNKTLYHHITILFPQYTNNTIPKFISDLTWAYYTATSRSFGNPNETTTNSSVFVPILDMVNHNPIPNCIQYFQPIEPQQDLTPIKHSSIQQQQQQQKSKNDNKKSTQQSTLINSTPKFDVILQTGSKWIEIGEELTFSYTIIDSEPTILPTLTITNQSELIDELRTSFNLAKIFNISLLRIPQATAPEGLIGSNKDNAYYLCNYGMLPTSFQCGDMLQLRFFRFLYPRLLCPSYDYLATTNEFNESIENDPIDTLPQLIYNDAPLKYIMPMNFHQSEPISIKRHMDIIQLILTELEISDITQFNWCGPDYYLIGFCRLLAAGGHYAINPILFHQSHFQQLTDKNNNNNDTTTINSPEETQSTANTNTITKQQSRTIVKKHISDRTNHILNLIELRIQATKINEPTAISSSSTTTNKKQDKTTNNNNNNNKKAKGGNKNTKNVISNIIQSGPKYTAIEYITMFSEEMIDEENEYGAMIMLYILLIHDADRYNIQPEQNRNDKYKVSDNQSLLITVQDYYRSILEQNYIQSLMKQYEYQKKTLIMHGLKVLATRLQLDLFNYDDAPKWLQQHWKVFDSR